MKRSTEILLLATVLAAAVVVPTVQAQPEGPKGPKGPPAERRAEMADRMAEHLGLTPEQQAKVQAIHQAERTQGEAIRNDATLSREQKQEKRKALRESTVQQVDAVLTPEQAAKAREMRAKAKDRMEERKERMEERKERRGERPPPKG
jgi:Spy/CpxP family protein refolding chaperone